MEAIRKIINIDKLMNIIDIPDDFSLSKVEILISPIKENTLKSQKVFVPDNFFGVTSISDLPEAIQEMRTEWDRS